MTAEQSREYYRILASQVVRMVCAGIIHGDLSVYNVLAGRRLVIIDLPQAINAAHNDNARDMLVRHMNNLATYFGRFVRDLLNLDYGREIWEFYHRGQLHPDITLTGCFEHEACQCGQCSPNR